MNQPIDPKPVTVTFELDDTTALALAQFVKRVGWSEMRGCAVSEQETYEIRDGINLLQRALADAGFAPR